MLHVHTPGNKHINTSKQINKHTQPPSLLDTSHEPNQTADEEQLMQQKKQEDLVSICPPLLQHPRLGERVQQVLVAVVGDHECQRMRVFPCQTNSELLCLR